MCLSLSDAPSGTAAAAAAEGDAAVSGNDTIQLPLTSDELDYTGVDDEPQQPETLQCVSCL